MSCMQRKRIISIPLNLLQLPKYDPLLKLLIFRKNILHINNRTAQVLDFTTVCFPELNEHNGIQILAWILLCQHGHATAQPVIRISPWEHRLNPRSLHVEFLVVKVVMGRFSSSISVSPAHSHSTICSIFLIYYLGLVYSAINFVNINILWRGA
jgi:hypothetical protein